MQWEILISIIFSTACCLKISEVNKLFTKDRCIQGSLTSFSSPNSYTLLQHSDQKVTTDQMEESLINLPVSNNNTPVKMNEKSVLSQINELAQLNKIEHSYKLLSEEGPPHDRVFRVRLILGDESFDAEGKSKKEAQRNAAVIALDSSWYEKPAAVNEKEKEVINTPTVKLNNIAASLGISVLYELVTNIRSKEISYGSNINSGYFDKLNSSVIYDLKEITSENMKTRGPATVKVSVDDGVFYGMGNSVQEARHDGALKAIEHMKEKIRLRQNFCLKEGYEEECNQQKESIKNPVSKVYEAAQKHKLVVSFDVIKESGPAHKKTFLVQCRLGDFKTEAEWSSKKEATRIAAEKMLSNLPHLSDITDDTNDIVNGLKKKKNNKKKNVLKEIEGDTDDTVGYGLSSMADSLMGLIRSDENEKQDTNMKGNTDSNRKGVDRFRAKNMLLKIAKLLNFEVTFHDLGGGSDHASSTLLSLNVEPPHICLGEGPTDDDSIEKASFEGLKLLRRSGLYDELFHVKEKMKLKEALEVINDLIENEKKDHYQYPVKY